MFSLTCLAQQKDTTTQPVQSKNWRANHSPKKATLLSLAFPGAGQFYNRSYWKMPIIYAGFGALVYAVDFNQGEYKRFGNYYLQATDDDPNTIPAFPGTPDQLRTKRNYYKKNRDLSIIGMAGLYALQIVDAHVDAHLTMFDVSDDLTLQWSPHITPLYTTSQRVTGGLSFQLTF